MLILQRKAGESLFIGDDIQVTIVSVDSGRVRLAIDAPRDLSILRSELRSAMRTNLDSAQEAEAPEALLSFIEGILNKDENPK